MSDKLSIPLIDRAQRHGDRKAVIATEGVFSYNNLMEASAGVAADLLQENQDLNGARVAFLVPPGFRYVAALWGIWRAGGLAVPLGVSYPQPELEYVVDDAEASILIAAAEFEDRLSPIARSRGLRLTTVDLSRPAACQRLPCVNPKRPAMIIYTSGTTGKPKGVVTTHEQIQAQITTLISAWEWSSDDHILHILPLHSVRCGAVPSAKLCPDSMPKLSGIVWPEEISPCSWQFRRCIRASFRRGSYFPRRAESGPLPARLRCA
jgi:malonyl-CoA/methylmalonyl-CoA synthetase